MNDSGGINRTNNRSRLQPLTVLREDRLRHGISLQRLSIESGLSTYRLSIIERDQDAAKPGEIEAHREATRKLAAERGIVIDTHESCADPEHRAAVAALYLEPVR